MSLKVVKRPFKSGGKVYTAGTVIQDPAGIPLFRSKIREGKVVLVDEHNLVHISTYLKYRQGVDNAFETLRAALDKPKQDRQAYLAKVHKAAEQYGVEVGDRPIEEVVAEIKALAAESRG